MSNCTSKVVDGDKYCSSHTAETRAANNSRNKTSNNYSSSSKTYNSTKSYDPDDYDIDGFYNDNKSDYSSYDDAWDGFEDGDGDWED